MNLFVGIGTISGAYENGRVLKFTLSIRQEKPCHVPCVIFDPNDEVKKFVQRLKSSKQVVWLQGKVASYEFEYKKKTIRKIDVVVHPRNIKPI